MIALLAGSFNPIHLGHLALARYVVEQKIAERVWFMVSPENPLKKQESLLPWKQRIAMVREAIEGMPEFELCTIEKRLARPFYTINTIEALHQEYPQHQFTILCGSDIAQQLPLWHESEKLQSMVQFLVYPRHDGVCSPQMKGAPMMEISSTEIRQSFEQGLQYYAQAAFGAAINCYNHCLELSPWFTPAQEMLKITNEILSFRNFDYYNP